MDICFAGEEGVWGIRIVWLHSVMHAHDIFGINREITRPRVRAINPENQVYKMLSFDHSNELAIYRVLKMSLSARV
jgi:hypothetical protein